MAEKMAAVSICPVCGSGKFSSHLTAQDHHYGIPGNWDLGRCDGCGLVFLQPMPSPDQIASLYPDDYYSFTFDETPRRTLIGRLRRRLMPFQAGEPEFLQPGSMVDVGCGNGWALQRYQETGWTVSGVEYSAVGAAAGRKRGIDVRTGSLIDAGFADESFDFVRMNHSFEHMVNPAQILDEVLRILKPGGMGFIAVPDISSPMAAVFKQYWYPLDAPVHVFHYSKQTLTRLLKLHGFEIIGVRSNTDEACAIGSLRIWVGRSGGRLSQFAAVNALLKILTVPAFWFSKLMDVLGRGDELEVIYRKPCART